MRKFLHKFGIHSIYWAQIKGNETSRTITRRCRYCDWEDTIDD